MRVDLDDSAVLGVGPAGGAVYAAFVDVLGGAVAWSALGLSHNITFVYGSLFFAAFFGSFVALNRRFPWRLGRVGIAYGLGLLLNAWYVAPQAATLDLIRDQLNDRRRSQTCERPRNGPLFVLGRY